MRSVSIETEQLKSFGVRVMLVLKVLYNMSKMLIVLIVFTHVTSVGGILTLDRLARRIDILEQGIQTEAGFRREDVQTLAEMIEGRLKRKENKTINEVTGRIEDNRELGVLHRAFADEKLVNSRTRRQVSELETSVNEFNRKLMKKVSSSFSRLESRLTNIESGIESNTGLLDILKTRFSSMLGEMKTVPAIARYASCNELYDNGHNVSGIYEVYPNGRPSPMRVYCDHDTDGGGWTLIQRREDGAEDFYRPWLDYKHGFGNLDGEFWLGNDFLNQLTRTCCHVLRVDMEDFDGVRKYAKFSKFQVGTNAQNYVLTVAGYSGDAGDSLTGHNGANFTTKDRDNDVSESNCAQSFTGAWWYTKCHSSNLNGKYLRGNHESYANGVNWYKWHGHHYSLKYVEMKFK